MTPAELQRLRELADAATPGNNDNDLLQFAEAAREALPKLIAEVERLRDAEQAWAASYAARERIGYARAVADVVAFAGSDACQHALDMSQESELVAFVEAIEQGAHVGAAGEP